MIKKLILTDEHLKLISLIRFGYVEGTAKDKKPIQGWLIDMENPYILLGRLSDLALVLGYSDQAIPGTDEDNIEGAALPDDVEEHLLEVHHYIVDNLCDIENLVHQSMLNGGLTPGTYRCIDDEGIWTKEK